MSSNRRPVVLICPPSLYPLHIQDTLVRKHLSESSPSRCAEPDRRLSTHIPTSTGRARSRARWRPCSSFWFSVKPPSPCCRLLHGLVQGGAPHALDCNLEFLERWPRQGTVIQALRNQFPQLSACVVVTPRVQQISPVCGIIDRSVENLAGVYKRLLFVIGPTQGDQGIHDLRERSELALGQQVSRLVRITYPAHLPGIHGFSIVTRRRCSNKCWCRHEPVPFFGKLFRCVQVGLARLSGIPHLLCFTSFLGVVDISQTQVTNLFGVIVSYSQPSHNYNSLIPSPPIP